MGTLYVLSLQQRQKTLRANVPLQHCSTTGNKVYSIHKAHSALYNVDGEENKYAGRKRERERKLHKSVKFKGNTRSIIPKQLNVCCSKTTTNH